MVKLAEENKGMKCKALQLLHCGCDVHNTEMFSGILGVDAISSLNPTDRHIIGMRVAYPHVRQVQE